jgi:c-di-GMP-binding flagellar brake protein YcgR
LSDNEFDILTETRNISASGAYCPVNKPLIPMTKLNVVLLIPLKKSRGKVIKKINCSGVVVRQEHIKDNGKYAYRVGIYFSDLKENDRKTLCSYITSCQKTSQVS